MKIKQGRSRDWNLKRGKREMEGRMGILLGKESGGK